MNNMMLSFLGLNNPLDFLSSPTFWIGVAIVCLVAFLIFLCFKYPKVGLPVLAVVFLVGILVLDVYSIIQLNYYYNAEGGIHGKLTGIFKTNEVEVVDNLTFEVKNIELTEETEGVYSASITTDKVLSLDTRESLGVFINGMPCDTTSEVESDYAIANYVYTFYDNDKTAICTDTLTLNFAFYENSTYLSLSTKGGTLPVEDCVEYWHHYFNKNGFTVKIAPFGSISSDASFVTGDTSNYAVINYYVNDELWDSECVLKGTTITLKEYNTTNFIGWYSEDDSILYETIVLEDNINFYAKLGDSAIEYTVTFNIRGNLTTQLYYEGQTIEPPTVPDVGDIKFNCWVDDNDRRVYFNSYELTEDVTFYASFYQEVSVNKTFEYTISEITDGVSIDLDDYVELNGSLERFDYYTDYSIELKCGVHYLDGDTTTTAKQIIYMDLSRDVFDSNVLGSNGLTVELDDENILHLNSENTFEPSSNAISYFFEIGRIWLYFR